MLLAHVVLDIQTKSLSSAYTYIVGSLAEDMEVGCAVEVSFGSRKAVGFVVGLFDGEPPAKAKEIESVLTKPYFNETGAQCARFISYRYVAPLSLSVRLFTPPGAIPKAVKGKDGLWRIEHPAINEVQEKLISKGDSFDSFTPKPNAVRQIAIIDTLKEGDVLQSELSLLYGNVASTIKALEKKRVIKIESKRKLRVDAKQGDASSVFKDHAPKHLTPSQEKAMEVVNAAMDAGSGEVVLIDGITGSGKTEIYIQAIARVLEEGRSAIVLVPEISLTPQTLARFRSRFGDTVALLHSRMSHGERFDQWDLIRSGSCRVVIGARSALFAPVKDLGLIVIDEEHESTYKQESAPRYVSRDVASWLAKHESATLILGSATPSIEALYKANTLDDWHHVELHERANGKHLPKIEIVDMAESFRSGKRSVFSHRLEEALKTELKAGHKVVLLLNQRGFAKFLLCRDCGFVPECRNCSTTLTYHERGNKLICHHCGMEIACPPVCPSCKSPYLKKFGIGTQRVEDELRALLASEDSVDPAIVLPKGATSIEDGVPNITVGNGIVKLDGRNDRESTARIHDHTEDGHPEEGESVSLSEAIVVRMDADTTAAKGAHQKLLEQFASANSAVLLGTQMIAKGLDFDDVTLVGVINADTQLHLPDFRASERTFDLIEQVAGRAGRAELEGKVYVQTYEADSIAIKAASVYDRDMFLRSELPKRKVLGFPPYVRMVNLIAWGRQLPQVKRVIYDIHDALQERMDDNGKRDWELLAPTPCAFERIRNDFRWHIVMKAPIDDDVSGFLNDVFKDRATDKFVNVAIDVDPLDLL